MESKYIKWNEIWQNEIDLTIAIDYCPKKFKTLLKSFIEDKDNLELMVDECSILKDGRLFFFFGETGGQNESDTQGWSRDYSVIFDSEYLFKSIHYSQG